MLSDRNVSVAQIAESWHWMLSGIFRYLLFQQIFSYHIQETLCAFIRCFTVKRWDIETGSNMQQRSDLGMLQFMVMASRAPWNFCVAPCFNNWCTQELGMFWKMKNVKKKKRFLFITFWYQTLKCVIGTSLKKNAFKKPLHSNRDCSLEYLLFISLNPAVTWSRFYWCQKSKHLL